MAAEASRHTYQDRTDLQVAIAERILMRPARATELHRAPAERIALWLHISRRTLFSTLARLELTLADVQRRRV